MVNGDPLISMLIIKMENQCINGALFPLSAFMSSECELSKSKLLVNNSAPALVWHKRCENIKGLMPIVIPHLLYTESSDFDVKIRDLKSRNWPDYRFFDGMTYHQFFFFFFFL